MIRAKQATNGNMRVKHLLEHPTKVLPSATDRLYTANAIALLDVFRSVATFQFQPGHQYINNCYLFVTLVLHARTACSKKPQDQFDKISSGFVEGQVIAVGFYVQHGVRQPQCDVTRTRRVGTAVVLACHYKSALRDGLEQGFYISRHNASIESSVTEEQFRSGIWINDEMGQVGTHIFDHGAAK